MINRVRSSRLLSATASRIGLAFVVTVLAISFIGPAVAPNDPNALISTPYSSPTSGLLLGSDYLGRDVLSRSLWGGRLLIGTALAALALGYALGTAIGLVAGYSGGFVDGSLMRSMDVMLALPGLLFLLVLAAGIGSSALVGAIGLGLVLAPYVARLVRTATLDEAVKAYVEAAVARGEPRRRILIREILPNAAPTVVSSAVPNLAGALLAIAGLSFLGLGTQPPTADWGVMIAENRQGMLVNPWAVVAPACLIAATTIGVKLVADVLVRQPTQSSFGGH